MEKPKPFGPEDYDKIGIGERIERIKKEEEERRNTREEIAEGITLVKIDKVKRQVVFECPKKDIIIFLTFGLKDGKITILGDQEYPGKPSYVSKEAFKEVEKKAKEIINKMIEEESKGPLLLGEEWEKKEQPKD